MANVLVAIWSSTATTTLVSVAHLPDIVNASIRETGAPEDAGVYVHLRRGGKVSLNVKQNAGEARSMLAKLRDLFEKMPPPGGYVMMEVDERLITTEKGPNV